MLEALTQPQSMTELLDWARTVADECMSEQPFAIRGHRQTHDQLDNHSSRPCASSANKSD